MSRFAVAYISVVAIFLVSAGSAGAYSIAGSSATQTDGGNLQVSMPQVPSNTFTPDWQGFFNNTPIQPFVNNLGSAGEAAVQSVQNSFSSGTPTFPTGGRTFLNSIDDWTFAHLGFRFSGIFMAILNVISWVLGLMKRGLDWLIGFLGR